MAAAPNAPPEVERTVSAEHIARNLRLLREAGTRLALAAEELTAEAVMQVARVDLSGRKMLLAPVAATPALRQPEVRVVGRYREREFWFVLTEARMVRYEGRDMLLARFPTSFNLVQRRRHYRTPVPEGVTTVINVENQRGWQIVGAIEDISPGGIKMRAYGDKRSLIAPDDRLPGSRITCEGKPGFVADLEVRGVHYDEHEKRTTIRIRFAGIGEHSERVLRTIIDEFAAETGYF